MIHGPDRRAARRFLSLAKKETRVAWGEEAENRVLALPDR